MKNINFIFENLKEIPHLKLPLQFDVKPLIEELKNIDYYEGYRKTKNEDESTFEMYYNNWKGVGIIDIVPDGRMSMMRSPGIDEKYVESIDGKSKLSLSLDKSGNLITYITDIGKNMPKCIETVHSVVEKPLRARISKIQPKSSLTWHSHFQNFLGKNTVGSNDKWKHVILHIPLITNNDVYMGVSKFPLKENPNQEIYYKNYEPGSLYVFNGWHDHNAFNNSNKERIHIMFYGLLSDKKLNPLLETTIKTYDGPRIK
jgi:hypothetical protein